MINLLDPDLPIYSIPSTTFQAGLPSEQALSQISSFTDHAMIITDDKARIKWTNKVFTEMTGYSFEEAIGKKPGELLQGPETDDSKVEYFRKKLKQKAPFTTEIMNYRKNGEKYYTRIHINPILDEDGICTGYTALQAEISGDDIQDKEAYKLASVASNTSNAVIIANPEGKIQWVNNGFFKLTGYALNEVYGRKPGHVLQGKDTDEKTVKEIGMTLSEKKPVMKELVNYRKDGSAYWTRLHINPVLNEDGTVERYVSIQTDVTKRVELEQSLRKEKQKADMINHSLNAAVEQIQEKNNAIKKKNEKMEHSLIYARRIQEAIMGDHADSNAYFNNSFLLNKPKDIVSGDFAVFYHNGNTRIAVIADCTGHGVPGAFMTLLGHRALDYIINVMKETDPATILTQLDIQVRKSLKNNPETSEITINDGMDMAIICHEEGTSEVSFAGAKNPLYIVRDGELIQYKGAVFPIGSSQFKDKKKFVTEKAEIKSGDALYLFSDGYQDQFGGEKNRKYMKKRFKSKLVEISELSGEKRKEELESDITEWMGRTKQTDDMLIFGWQID